MELASFLLANALNNCNEHKVSVACGKLSKVSAEFKYDHAVYRSKTFSYLTPLLYRQNRKRMMRMENIDILHGMQLHEGGWWALKHKRNVPIVATSHGSDVQTVESIQYGAALFKHSRKKLLEVIEKVDRLIAVSEMNKQHLLNLGANESKIRIIPNGCSWDAIQEVPKTPLDSAWDIKPHELTLISVGRNAPIKRLWLLFHALSKLKGRLPFKLICVGQVRDLKEIAQQYRILDNCIFTGPVPASYDQLTPPFPSLINLYKHADVYVSTSYVESFGMAALDAIASGTPAIIGKNHGIKDFLDSSNSYKMEKDSTEELMEILMQAYKRKTHNSNKPEIVANSVKHLNWNRIAQKHLELYRELL